MNPSYLQRRLSLLINKFEEGKSFFSEDLLREGDGRKLIEELSLLKKLPDGSVDTSSATPLVRSVARILYAALLQSGLASAEIWRNFSPKPSSH